MQSLKGKKMLREGLVSDLKAGSDMIVQYQKVMEVWVERGAEPATLAGIEALILFEEKLMHNAREKLRQLRKGQI